MPPLRERFSIGVEGGEGIEANGKIVDHDYTIERSGDKVAAVSKRWFRMRSQVQILPRYCQGRRKAPLV